MDLIRLPAVGLSVGTIDRAGGQLVAAFALLDVGEDLEKALRPSAIQRLIFV